MTAVWLYNRQAVGSLLVPVISEVTKQRIPDMTKLMNPRLPSTRG